MLTAVEIGHGAAGGFAAMMLAALGGEVTRIETPADRAHDAAERRAATVLAFGEAVTATAAHRYSLDLML